MSEPLTTGGATLPPTLARQMDRVCDRFEAAWRAYNPPRIEDYLDEVPEPGRVAFGPNGKQIAAASLDGIVRVWDTTADQ